MRYTDMCGFKFDTRCVEQDQEVQRMIIYVNLRQGRLFVKTTFKLILPISTDIFLFLSLPTLNWYRYKWHNGSLNGMSIMRLYKNIWWMKKHRHMSRLCVFSISLAFLWQWWKFVKIIYISSLKNFSFFFHMIICVSRS